MTFHGQARYTGRNSVDETLDARHILIAAGATPVTLGIPGEEHLITNEEFLALETLPERIVMVGGGYIAAEFSHIAARAGVQVTVLQRGERMLTHFDPDLVGWLMEKFQAVGIDVRTGTVVEDIERTGAGYRVKASANGQSMAFEADLVVHAAGRVPNLDSLMKVQKVPDWFTARRAAKLVYGFKVLVEEETDRVLGAHLVGPHVDEIINLFALAIRQGLTATALKQTIFAYPTGASDIGDML